MTSLPRFSLFRFLLLIVLGLGTAAQAGPVRPQQAQTPTLEVSVAVPEEGGQYLLRLSSAVPYIDVIIRNASKSAA